VKLLAHRTDVWCFRLLNRVYWPKLEIIEAVVNCSARLVTSNVFKGSQTTHEAQDDRSLAREESDESEEERVGLANIGLFWTSDVRRDF
jgi:hypothetical protein